MRILITALIIALVGAFSPVLAADVPIMTKEELNEKLDSADVVVIDVRQGRDWSSSEFKIKGAVRGENGGIDSLMASLDKSKTYVLYCS
jgi:rhodanese-related sulfurtransferase